MEKTMPDPGNIAVVCPHGPNCRQRLVFPTELRLRRTSFRPLAFETVARARVALPTLRRSWIYFSQIYLTFLQDASYEQYHLEDDDDRMTYSSLVLSSQ